MEKKIKTIEFSVIIPVFNNLSALKNAVNSVRRQSLDSFEIIIVDDNSSDSEEVKSYLYSLDDPRIKYFKNQRNMNAAFSRNFGVKQSSGKFISFLDCDDIWFEDKLSSVKKCFKDDVDVVVHRTKIVRDKKSKDSKPFSSNSNYTTLTDRVFCLSELIQTSAISLRRKVALEVMFNEALVRHQDYNLLVNLERNDCKVYYLNEVLSVWNAPSNRQFLKKGATLRNAELWIKNDGDSLSNNAMAYYLCLEYAQIAILEGAFSSGLRILFFNLSKLDFISKLKVFKRLSVNFYYRAFR
jgi:glycosyltransferase involved in cell wall biosynthesis